MATAPSSRGGRGVVASVVAVATALAAVRASAEGEPAPKTSSLAWLRLPGSESCVASQDLARAVEAKLGREAFVPPSRADLSIEARVAPIPGGKGHRAVILVRGASGETLGERTIEDKDPTCARLTEPLALVLALLIDPEAATKPRPAPSASAASAPPSPEASAPPSPSASPPPPPPPPPPEPPKRVRDGFRAEGTVVSQLVTGLTPSPALGFGGGGLLQTPRVPVSLRGSAAIFVPVSADRSGVHAAFDMALLSGAICPTWYPTDRVRFFGCVGSQLGGVRARAVLPSVSDDDLRPIWNVYLEGRIAVQLAGPLVLAASAAPAVAVLRKDLRLDRAPGDAVVVHELAPVSLFAELGLGVVVP